MSLILTFQALCSTGSAQPRTVRAQFYRWHLLFNLGFPCLLDLAKVLVVVSIRFTLTGAIDNEDLAVGQQYGIAHNPSLGHGG